MERQPFDLEGFEPLNRIGTGGFGEVWLARQTNIDRRVAIKIGHNPIADETVQLRFERECIALGRLSGHPNIVDVFTAGRLDDGRPYLVLEYLGGGTLWERLQRGTFTEDEIKVLGIELADALSVAHEAGVLHRDLKPENVLLRPNGAAVLSDFGIARLHDGANTSSHSITASVAYAAPEVLSGRSPTDATDIYGIGVCLLACWMRDVPFVDKKDESIHPIINRVLSGRPPDLRKMGMSAELAALVARLLAKNPDDRPPSARAVKEEFLALDLTRGPAATGPPTRPIDMPRPDGPDGARHTGGERVASSGRGTGSAPSPFRPANGPGPNGPGRPPRTPSQWDRVRLFGAAFGATLLVGGLIIFALSRLGGDDPTTDEGEAGQTTDIASSSSQTSVGTDTTVRPALVLPLTLTDGDLGDEATVTQNISGPSESQFCGNTPETTGLVDWTGNTMAGSTGLPLIVQQLSRFESASDAEAYVDGWLGTVSCEEWRIPAQGDTPEIVLVPVVAEPHITYGDETGEVVYGGAAGFVSVFSRNVIVRRGETVYTLSITSLTDTDLTTLDELLELATSRLGL